MIPFIVFGVVYIAKRVEICKNLQNLQWKSIVCTTQTFLSGNLLNCLCDGKLCVINDKYVFLLVKVGLKGDWFM